MREAEIPVKFLPQGKNIFVLKGTKILEAAARTGIVLNTPCGGKGTCGKCKVRVLYGACEPDETERAVFNTQEIKEGFRLACHSSIRESATVEVPNSSLFAPYYKILTESNNTLEQITDPPIYKRYVELPTPSLEDATSDIDRLQKVVGLFDMDIRLLQKIPLRLRELDFRGTAVFANHKLIDFEQGNTESECFAITFDIGTTTLVGVLIELCTGRELANTSRINPQTSFGDDVLSRILHASQCPQCLDQMHREIITAINNMIQELVKQVGIEQEQIYEITFAGNTTMQQLLCGVNPEPFGEIPFVPAAGGNLLLQASDLGLNIHHRGRVYVFPVIGGFVGGIQW